MGARFALAGQQGVTEDLIADIPHYRESKLLTDREKAAIHYADLSSTDHLSITEGTFDDLREHFSEADIVALGMIIAFFIGYGRLAAAWHMTEELPEGFQAKAGTVAPWTEEAVLVRG